MSSLHATYHWGKDGLEAVLMRTTPSGADDRFYWEHAGRREYAFRFRFTEPDAPLSVPTRMGQEAMRPLLVRLVDGKGDGILPLASPLIALDGEGLILSAVYPDGDDMIVRFFEADGKRRKATIRIALAKRLERVTLLGEAIEELPGTSKGWAVEVAPYEIVTLRATR
jgi:alpha-mannosidase